MTETRDSDADELDRLLRAANPVPREPVLDAAVRDAQFARLASAIRGTEPAPLRVLRRRPAVALGLAAALLLITAGAIAAVGAGPWWQGAEPPANPKVVERQLAPPLETSFPPAADRLRARTVARSNGAALVAAPVGESGYCLVPSLPGSPDLGVSCVYSVTNVRSGAADDMRSYARPASAGDPRWIVYGRITDPRAATLDLTQAAGQPFSIPVQRGGFFLADVPEELWSRLDGSAGEAQIRDAAGNVLRRGCVDWGRPPTSSAAGRGSWPLWVSGPPCVPRRLPPPPPSSISEAQKLAEVTLTLDYSVWKAGARIALWRGQSENGEPVLAVAAAVPPPTGRETFNLVGGTWPQTPPIRPGEVLRVSFSATRLGPGAYSYVVEGLVKPGSGVGRIELRAGADVLPVALGGDAFLAQIPRPGPLDELPPGGPYSLVAFDGSDRELARVDLDELFREARPR
jgi:hypothetical protein